LEITDKNGTQKVEIHDGKDGTGGGTGSGQGLTQAQINALDALFQIVSYTALPTQEYEAFKIAFDIGVAPGAPDEPVVSDKMIYQSGTTLVIKGEVNTILDNANLIIS
jgi:hypothetical protein